MPLGNLRASGEIPVRDFIDLFPPSPTSFDAGHQSRRPTGEHGSPNTTVYGIAVRRETWIWKGAWGHEGLIMYERSSKIACGIHTQQAWLHRILTNSLLC